MITKNLPANVSPISDFQFTEKISLSGLPGQNETIARLSVPLALTERRIYLYLEVVLSSAAIYSFGCLIKAMRNQRAVGLFPATIADYTTGNAQQSVFSLVNSGGSPVGDSLVVRLAQPFDITFPIAVVQPLRINADIDEIILEHIGHSGTTLAGYRAFMATLSTRF